MKHKPKKKRPIRRKFWSLLKFMPASLRAAIIRSQFEVDYNLPKEIVLKQAETEAEIKEALKLVHDSYVELDYIDPNEAQLRFSKYHALPTTVILVAKWEDEVIGTLSIIPDSALGLPSDTTWSLDRYRKQGKLIAEISSLCIKKDFRMRRGRLLMPLCKIMYLYCTKILRLDGLVIASTLEVEPFYTDVLLFKPVVKKTGQQHLLVKGNPSTCCYLELNADLVEKYRQVYSHRPANRNLHNFFVLTDTPNILLPNPKYCIQSYLIQKNHAQTNILAAHQSLITDFSDMDKMIIKGLDITNTLPDNFSHLAKTKKLSDRTPRPEVRVEGWCTFNSQKYPIQCLVMDVSFEGLKLALRQTLGLVETGERLFLTLEFNGKPIHCRAEVRWNQSQTKFGYKIIDASASWKDFINEILGEIHSQQDVPVKTVFRKSA